MKVLRHEVFDEGCEAACNGPYANKWSKTMIGYGSEDDHFVLELTYNYSISSYKLGNDLQYINIGLDQKLFDQVKATTSAIGDNEINLNSPDGYKFIITKLDGSDQKNDVKEVCLGCTNLKKSLSYWIDLLGLSRYDRQEDELSAKLGYAKGQASLVLRTISGELDHKSAYGRIAFSCPSEELKLIQKKSEEADQRVLTPFLSLDTPGKATVQVIILADPDGHEICFVGDEGFRELSRTDPDANNLIEKSIAEDKSDEWFEKKNRKKEDI